MTRHELHSHLRALGVTEERAERLGTAWSYLAAAVLGYKNVQSLTNATNVSEIVAGSLAMMESMFNVPSRHQLTEAELDEYFRTFLPQAHALREKARKQYAAMKKRAKQK